MFNFTIRSYDTKKSHSLYLSHDYLTVGSTMIESWNGDEVRLYK